MPPDNTELKNNMLLAVGRRSKRGGWGGTSLMSHTSHLQPAAGRRVREAAGHGAALLPPPGLDAQAGAGLVAHAGAPLASAMPVPLHCQAADGCTEQLTFWT